MLGWNKDLDKDTTSYKIQFLHRYTEIGEENIFCNLQDCTDVTIKTTPEDTEPPGCPGKESESTYQSGSVNVEILKPIDKQRQRTNVEHRRISINHLAGRARYVTGGFALRGFLEHTKFNTDVAL